MPNAGYVGELSAIEPKVAENGATPIKLLQPAHRAAALSTISAADLTVSTIMVGRINGLISAAKNAGIMLD